MLKTELKDYRIKTPEGQDLVATHVWHNRRTICLKTKIGDLFTLVEFDRKTSKQSKTAVLVNCFFYCCTLKSETKRKEAKKRIIPEGGHVNTESLT